MPRAHFTKAVIRRVSGAPASGSVSITKPDGSALGQPVYAADTGTGELGNPYSFTNGVIDFYLAVPTRVRMVITPTDSAAQAFENVDVPIPAAASAAPGFSRDFLHGGE